MASKRVVSCEKKIAPLAVFFSCAVVALAALVGACTGKEAGSRAFVVEVDGRVVHRGPAAFTTREAHPPENVVFIKGIGEVIVTPNLCRFVRSDAGLQALQILERKAPCVDVVDDRVCFNNVRFGDAVRVDGCADRNELFLSRVNGDEVTTATGFAPRTLIERCVEVPAKDPHYLRVDDIGVDDVEQPRQGLRFRWNGDGFDVCFLSRKQGKWHVTVQVDDGEPVALAGDVDDL